MSMKKILILKGRNLDNDDEYGLYYWDKEGFHDDATMSINNEKEISFTGEFITWFIGPNGGHYHGHYFISFEHALKDFLERLKESGILIEDNRKEFYEQKKEG